MKTVHFAIVANTILAVTAWTCATVLITGGFMKTGVFMAILPLLYHMDVEFGK